MEKPAAQDSAVIWRWPGNPGYAQRLEDGTEIDNYYGYKYTGVNEEEKIMIWRDGKTETEKVIASSKGKETDKTCSGHGAPRVELNWGNSFANKNFDLSLYFSGRFDYKILNNYQMYYRLVAEPGVNLLKDADTRNRQITSGKVMTDYFPENGDYFKLDNLTLGWSPKIVSKRFSNTRIYGTVKNVSTLTKFSGLDPTIVNVAGPEQGIDKAVYASDKSIFPIPSHALNSNPLLKPNSGNTQIKTKLITLLSNHTYKKSIFTTFYALIKPLDTSEPTESELVKALSKGDIKAFNDLFQIYGNRIFRFALGYLKSEPDAEELVQDVFLKIWEKRSELKENLSFKAYIFTISFNIIRKHFIKKTLTAKYFEQQVIEDADLSTIQDIDFQSTKKAIDHLVGQLPARRKEVFVKSRFEGYSIKEIAEELGTSPKTIENQLGDALKFIREHLGKDDFAGILFFTLFFS